MNLKAMALHYNAEFRNGFYAPDQHHFVHSIGPEHGNEFFAHPQDGQVPPAYYTVHEDYGPDYAHNYVQPHYHPEPDSEILNGGAQKNAPIFSDKHPRYSQYL